ncbi:HalOD1 output domain-containing protein [Halorientalis pallida]|uniref:HalOD1 output domain-containing protein n=1 Tax=Halorientalis pallida TaxID=2479928 RepID=UPI003C6EC3B4
MDSDSHDDAVSTGGGETTRTIDWSRPDPVSSAVVEAAVAKTGTDAVSLPPLEEFVDGDALNRLFTRDTDGRLSFEYAGLAVVVSTLDGVTVS